ncbi:ead/Ea22-like family protein [Citrobacter sp. RHBSTW-00881]|uniref:ead/Ea22-like family protein n=1 Tax=Citrobacter sp. RHBSTW-00881 TaxID=2742667 RepID=UPI0015E95993|nr:ead/Ea22-like family protein [Citrobacter sp. RHBSTW-00881]QLS64186.1 ead/Ea22-like family protein [Citrobacter sp. RHBSTW-00881]
MTVLNKHRELRKELSNPAIGSNHHLRKLALSLLDELETKEEQRANWFQMAQKLGEDLDAAEKRIAEHNFENQLLANADRDITALRQRIAELEARTVTVQLPADNAAESESPEDEATAWFDEGWNARGKADKEALIAAGIGVKGE